MTRKQPEWVSIGKITAPHGLRGAVRAVSLSDAHDRFEQIDKVYVVHDESEGTRRPLHVTKVGYRKNLVILQFAEITDFDQAESLRDALIQVPIDQVSPLPEDMYYVFEIVGLDVFSVDGTHIGKVVDVISVGSANDIYVVDREGKEQAMIPAVRQFVKEIDIDKGRMTIDPIPGLL